MNPFVLKGITYTFSSSEMPLVLIDASAKDGRRFCLLFSLGIFERNSGNNFLRYVFYIAEDVEFVTKE